MRPRAASDIHHYSPCHKYRVTTHKKRDTDGVCWACRYSLNAGPSNARPGITGKKFTHPEIIIAGGIGFGERTAMQYWVKVLMCVWRCEMLSTTTCLHVLLLCTNVLWHQAGSFNTLEGFWKNYVHLKRPSSISTNVNVYLFRDEKGHVPMWEVRHAKLNDLDLNQGTQKQTNARYDIQAGASAK